MSSKLAHSLPETVLPGILLIILMQTLVLAAMIANRQNVLSSDTIVVLETKPIDPRSLFRGDYVRLDYDINELQLDELSGDQKFKKNDTVYVVLQQSGQYWNAEAIYSNKDNFFKNYPDKMQNKQYALIQGVVKHVINRQWDRNDKTASYVTSLRVSYGIENYFVPEGEGLKLERPEAGDKVTLEIALDDDGHAVIKTLLVNGIRQYEETLF